MASHEDLPDKGSDPATEAASLGSIGGSGDEFSDGTGQCERSANGLVEKGQDLFETLKSRPVIIAAIVAGGTAAAVIGIKLAYDRSHRSEKGYHRAVRQLEDAKDALIAASSELPERGRAVMHRMTHR